LENSGPCSFSSLESNPSPVKEAPTEELPERFQILRKISAVPCLCNTKEFEVIITGSDSVFEQLQQCMKELVQVEKHYGSTLTSIGEVSLFEKIKRKKQSNSWKDLIHILKIVGKEHVEAAEFLSVGLLANLNSVDKEMKTKHKEISSKFKTISSSFVNSVNKLETIQNNLVVAEQNQQKASSVFEHAKKKLDDYQKIAKKEMKLKIISNEILKLKNELESAKDALQEESEKYLPLAEEIVEDYRELQQQKAEQVRSMLQSWIASMEGTASNNYLLWQRVIDSTQDTEPEDSVLQQGLNQIQKPFLKMSEDLSDNFSFKKLWNKTFKKEVTENQEKAENAKNKLRKISSSLNKLNEVLETMIKAEKNYYQGFMKILENIPGVQELNLDQKWTAVAEGLAQMKESVETYVNSLELEKSKLKQYQVEISELLQTFHKGLNAVAPLENRLKQLEYETESLFEDSKHLVLKALGTKLSETQKGIGSVVHCMDEAEEVLIDGNFSSRALVHRYECPFYIYEVHSRKSQVDLPAEHVKVGNPESALWLNDLLGVFIKEWSESSRFQTYICRRLKKVYNKNRPSYLGEIEVTGVEIGGQAPEVKNFVPLSKENPEDFYYEFDLLFKGEIRINLEFEIKWSIAKVLVSVRVVAKALYGRMQVYYMISDKGKSWYTFISEPAFQITIEPVLGKMNKLALSKFPQLNSFLVNIMSKKVRKYVWPNKRSVKIPKGKKPSDLLS